MDNNLNFRPGILILLFHFFLSLLNLSFHSLILFVANKKEGIISWFFLT